MAAWRIGQVTCVTGCSGHRFVLQWVWRSYRCRQGVREVVRDMGDELERCRALGITSFACKGGGFSADRMVRLVAAKEYVRSYQRPLIVSSPAPALPHGNDISRLKWCEAMANQGSGYTEEGDQPRQES